MALAACTPPATPPAPVVVVYDAIQVPAPVSLPSLGYEATSTKEFGDDIYLAGTARHLVSTTVALANWALQSTPTNVAFCAANPSSCSATGFRHPITMNVYSVDRSAPVPKPGTLLGSVTQTVDIRWRPEDDPSCDTPADPPTVPVAVLNHQYRGSDGICHSGYITNVTLDLTAANITVPDEIIVGIAYNTTHYGSPALGGAGGPYDSLNVALVPAPTTGVDVNLDDVFWNTSYAGFYTDHNAVPGVFQQDTLWTSQQPSFSLRAS